MRLLDTTTKELKTFYGKEIPRYAILSHMWGREEDEVLFRHIAGSNADRREGKRRKGYAKIEGACKQAIKDGWKYIWIDTCCIDKGSSAELSEAINSMYEWYRDSEACYVYLEDVGSGRGVQSGKNAAFPIVSLEHSRWFSRGWTLQELIAPQYVVFYSKDWIDIGTKGSLRDTISAVTRIRVEMLIAYDPKKASVAERMSWAASRKTTRAEDVAYCLMGLLGVNMPLLYGEGDRAFRRLQGEIMKVSDDDSLFAWKDRLDDRNNYLNNTRGMLATSPWNFRDGINIVRSKDGAYSPYSMTNQGLQIKLPLLPIDLDLKRNLININSKNIFKTTLKCTLRNTKPTRSIVIYLKKTNEGYYQRIFPHWLHETEANPNEPNPTLISLLIPQVNASTTQDRPKIQDIQVEILPTTSGFTVDAEVLVEGRHQVIYFGYQEKYFVVVVGSDEGMPWLDFIDPIDETWSFHESYKEGGPRIHVRERLLDQLSEKIKGEDWWVGVSVRKTGHSQGGPCLRAFINIQRTPVWAQGFYTPSAVSAGNDGFDGDPLGNLDYHNVHPDFKKESHDWFAMFSPKVKRVLDVGLMYTLPHKSEVHCVQFSRDGKYLATGSDTVQVYDMETGAEICTFIDEYTKTAGHRHSIHSICFSPDSKFLATGDTGRGVKLWDIGEKCIHRVFNGHQSTIRSLCFSVDGHLLISGSGDGTVRIWKIADGSSRILTMHPDQNRKAGIRSISISRDGRLLAAGSSNGIIRIWDIVTTQLQAELWEHRSNVHVAFTPHEKGLVSGSTDKSLMYWDVSRLVPTRTERKVEDLNAGRNLGKINGLTMTFTGPKDPVNSIAISHDGHWVISGSENGHALFWDLRSATAQFILNTSSGLFHEPGFQFPLFPSPVSLDMSPVDNIFATTSEGNEVVRVWHYDDV